MEGCVFLNNASLQDNVPRGGAVLHIDNRVELGGSRHGKQGLRGESRR
jgi:hypothetical protein